MAVPVMKVESSPTTKKKKRYVRKHEPLYLVLDKIKLWASRNGILHGIRKIELKGTYIELTTHCGHHLYIKNSKTGRGSRWLRNKWCISACRKCKIPTWKLEKYSSTSFK